MAEIAVGADHAGFLLKETILESLQKHGWTVLDLGTHDQSPVDYPDIAGRICAAVLDGRCQKGIVICGSGVGACVAANKIAGIRAGLCHDNYSAHQGVEHDDMNILCLGARVVGPEVAMELSAAFAGARFSGEARHVRRLDKVLLMEKSQIPGDATSSADT